MGAVICSFSGVALLESSVRPRVGLGVSGYTGLNGVPV